MPHRRRRIVVLMPLIALTAGVATGFVLWGRTYHFAEVVPAVLYRDGMKSDSTFATALRQSGAKTVVSLIDPDEQTKEPFAHETSLCNDAGATLVRIPVRLGGWPTSEQVQQFLAITTDS